MKLEKVYACYSKDKDVRLSSSSGAVFSSLAEYVLNKNGIIYGVAMSEDCYSAEFIAVTDRSELIKLRGSKYLQAKVGDTFKKGRIASRKTCVIYRNRLPSKRVKEVFGKRL